MWQCGTGARTIFQPLYAGQTLLYLFHFFMLCLKMKDLSSDVRGQIVGMQKAGLSHTKIAKKLDIPPGSVSTTIRRFKATGATDSRPRGKRPPKLDKHARRRVLGDIDLNPHQTWDKLGTKEAVSGRTVARMAHIEGLHKRKARPKPFLTPPQVQKRLRWAQDVQDMDWGRVICTDEASCETGEKKGPTYTIRRAGEAFLLKNLIPTFRQDRETIMIWGAVSLGHKWPLIRLTPFQAPNQPKSKKIDKYAYVNQVLYGHLAGYCSELRREGILDVVCLEDGAPPHRNGLAAQAREELHIKQLFHPPNSPDLNAIEPLWGIVKRRVSKLRHVASTANKLWEQIQQVWDGIEQSEIDGLIMKMEERRKAVVAAKALHTCF